MTSFIYLLHSIRHSDLFIRIFNRANFTKLLIIFFFGLLSRLLINYLYDINVFSDYFNPFSIIYYLFFSSFIVFVSEIVDFFHLNLIPHFPKLPQPVKFSQLPKINPDALKLSYIRDVLKLSYIRDVFRNLFSNKQSNYLLSMTQDSTEANPQKLGVSKNLSLHKDRYFDGDDGGHKHGLKHRDKTGDLRGDYSKTSRPSKTSRGILKASSSETSRSPHKDTINNTSKSKSNTQILPNTTTSINDHNNIAKNLRLTYADRVKNISNPKLNPRFNNTLPKTDVLKHNMKSAIPNIVESCNRPDSNYLLPAKSCVPQARNNTSTQPVKPTLNTLLIPSNATNLTSTTPKLGSLTPVTLNSGFFEAVIEGETVYLKKVDPSDVVGGKREVKGLSTFVDPSTNNPVYLPSNTPISRVDITSIKTKSSDTLKHDNNPFYNHKVNKSTGSNDSKWSSRGVVGFTDPNSSTVNLETRRVLINRSVMDKLNDQAKDSEGFKEVSPIFVNEVDIQKKGLLGNAKLGFHFIDTNLGPRLKSIYVKYHNVSKRKFYWTIWEGRKDNYSNYLDFKQSWDPNTKIFRQIIRETKTDISDGIKNLVRDRDPFNVNKNKVTSVNRPNISYPKNFRGTKGSFK